MELVLSGRTILPKGSSTPSLVIVTNNTDGQLVVRELRRFSLQHLSARHEVVYNVAGSSSILLGSLRHTLLPYSDVDACQLGFLSQLRHRLSSCLQASRKDLDTRIAGTLPR